MISQQCLGSPQAVSVGGNLWLIIQLKSLKIIADTFPELFLKFDFQGIVLIIL